MKKTILAVTLVMALTLSLAATTFAASIAGTGEGSVVFKSDTENPEIVDPEEKPDPEDPDYSKWGIESSNIYFGSWDMTTATATYPSTEGKEQEVPGGDKLGLLIRNKNTRDWNVTMWIGEFTVLGVNSIADYDLEMKKDVEHTSEGTVASASNTMSLRPGAINAVEVMNGTGTGMIGANWTGELTIPANGVKKDGTNQAIITWTATGETPAA